MEIKIGDTRMSTNTPSLAELKRAIAVATPGPYHIGHVNEQDDTVEVCDPTGRDIARVLDRKSEAFFCISPQTAGRLIQALEIYEKELSTAEEYLRSCGYSETSDPEFQMWQSIIKARAEVRKLVRFEGDK